MHTPGPWEAHSYGILAPGRQLQRGRMTIDMPIADVCNAVDVPADEKHANASLIAAAPELLAACRESVFRLNEIQTKIFDGIPVAVGDFNQALRKLATAISKAEGRAEIRK